LEQIARVMNPLPALTARKNPWLALVLGFLLSGVALGVYFRSWIDLIVPTAIWLLLIVTPETRASGSARLSEDSGVCSGQ